MQKTGGRERLGGTVAGLARSALDPPRQAVGLPQPFQTSSGSPLHDFLRNAGTACSATVTP